MPSSKARKAYYQRNKRAVIARAASYLRTPRGQLSRRRSHLRRRYGITIEQYDELLAQQDGKCAICRATTPNNGLGDKYFDIDHDHKSLQVRGLLCRECNTMLGQIEKLYARPGLADAVKRYLETE